MTPRCSIVVSAYKATAFLGSCFQNLLEQSDIGQCQIIVVMCDPSESDRAIINDYNSRFPCLEYLETPRESLYQSWNRALQSARGKYFVNANVDDALNPNGLRILASALDDEPEAALAYGDWLWATAPNPPHPWDCRFRRCVHPEYHPSLPLFYAYAGCHQFWRTDKLRELGGFNASYAAAGDYEALCRVALKRWHAVYVPEVISAFYQNPGGLSRAFGTSIKEFTGIRDRFRGDVTIGDLYEVDPGDAAACARAWTDLGRRALSLHIPWSEEATPEPDFSAECARRALALDPWSHEARSILAAATDGRRAGVGRAVAWATALFAGPPLPPPRARTPSPVFRPAEQNTL